MSRIGLDGPTGFTEDGGINVEVSLKLGQLVGEKNIVVAEILHCPQKQYLEKQPATWVEPYSYTEAQGTAQLEGPGCASVRPHN